MLGTLTWVYFAALGQGLGSGRRMGGPGDRSPARADGCSASAGSSLGCFHWSQGVKLRASVRLLLEWLRGAGFEQLAQQFFAKLASVANLLAMPGSQLVQVRGAGGSQRRDGHGQERPPLSVWGSLQRCGPSTWHRVVGPWVGSTGGMLRLIPSLQPLPPIPLGSSCPSEKAAPHLRGSPHALSPHSDDLAIPASRIPSTEPRAAPPGAEPVPGGDGRGLHRGVAARRGGQPGHLPAR